jgi:tRNA threonylcarbamoyladenosine modification (KEOPS) complex  Pcc1 subunit
MREVRLEGLLQRETEREEVDQGQMTLTSRAELTVKTVRPDVVAGALSPELAEKIPRTKVAVEKRDGEVRIVIEADDQNALRAALNSYIRWTNVAEETAKEAGRR